MDNDQFDELAKRIDNLERQLIDINSRLAKWQNEFKSFLFIIVILIILSSVWKWFTSGG